MPPLNRQWRTVSELTDDPAFLARAAEEFPGLAAALAVPRDRREVLKLMAAAFAMAGIGGCGGDSSGGALVPPVIAAPGMVPGRASVYSTVHVLAGYATGILVNQHMGRPGKVDGNPLHPASLGATDAIGEAQLLDFYDPDRAAGITRAGVPVARRDLLTFLAKQRASLAADGGSGFRILTGSVSSPTLAAQIDALVTRYPGARWHQWEPVARDNVFNGSVLAYGRPLECIPDVAAADVLLAIDSDLLSSAPGHLRHARDFASRRNPARMRSMSRLYAVESTPTLTGSVADHRFIAGARELDAIVRGLADAVLNGRPSQSAPSWLAAVAADLVANPARALVHVGPDQPPETHALVHAINERLAAPGHTLGLIAPVAATPVDHGASLRALTEDMQAARVTSLLVVDCNPVLTAPGVLDFSAALERVPVSLTLAAAPSETSAATLWAVPMAHAWESWSDARAYDGTASIVQPQSLPLYDGMSAHQLLDLFASGSTTAALEHVQATWRSRMTGDFERGWHDALADGVIAATTHPRIEAPMRASAAGLRPMVRDEQPLDLLFRPDPFLWDGRYANNAWLQELPRPLSKLTWDNPLLIADRLAHRVGLTNGDRVRVSVGTNSVVAPVWILPGQADACITATLGFGRRGGGTIAAGAGVDLYPLMGCTGAVSITRVAGRVELATTEHHNRVVGGADDLVRHGTLAAYAADAHFLKAPPATTPLYERKPGGPAAWAMSIDLNACIGCTACVVACQSENNIPVVGKSQVLHEREMHWLRIDRYWQGTVDAPETFFQPVLCMHCEEAPCEVVCPVGATVHDSEGLNLMVYNRCIGTRFCSNNCPYKVRRFNYSAYAADEPRAPASRNPEVTVRARGVMEKCTFCVQRITAARIAADRDDVPVGEVRTACQAACPTRAITFGNVADPDSAVAQRKASPLDYVLLAGEATRPRVSYEARIRNVNPAIDGGAA